MRTDDSKWEETRAKIILRAAKRKGTCREYRIKIVRFMKRDNISKTAKTSKDKDWKWFIGFGNYYGTFTD